jgi:hypothetical protein
MKFLGLCGVLLAAGLATGGAKAQEAAVKELIPTGKLRFGIAFAPKMSALFVVKDPGGSPRGVTADSATSWHSALACRSSLWSRLTPAC